MMENVGGAVPKLRGPVMLCGPMLGVDTYRHRFFETGGGLTLAQPDHPVHLVPQAKMGRLVPPGWYGQFVGSFSGVGLARKVLGVPWMNRDGIRECIPPAYTEHIGRAALTHLIPALGAHRLDKLGPEHNERFYGRMQTDGRRAGTIRQIHRTFRTVLNEAVRRGHITRNPVQLAKAPRISEEEIEPYTVEEVQQLSRAADDRRNSARWAVALALGLRQGEALGLKWTDVDLDRGVLMVRRSRRRSRYAHGCGDTCGRKAGYCPQRQRTNPETADTKSRAGRRAVGLPSQLVDLLRTHLAKQQAERTEAGADWTDEGWLFATPTGRGASPRTDYDDWKELLDDAKVRDGRLHDARHTAATVLLILGVSERAVMGLMGWSTTAMAARYQHMVDSVRSDVARQVDGLIWSTDGDYENPSTGE
ncbi:tyrosine-type recombinase/integrase [Streptomyces andamanensis]|uniref:Tyrosine-type recombinase/integrase n=1 Tax=Streptomyces andamanensis TaxID=1565035 RepID=A0ABV8TDL4_9ACTN